MTEPAAPSRPPNRLARSTSPYLLQHAHNPVDWYPWGPEALERARAENKPILLSIGYSSCHWCHVMERESFENDEIAALMNARFVCVKVDREERPDLDDIYMAATVAMNQGHGGWPMTVFLTPEQEPFFAGTYFPPEDKWGRPGFRTLLTRIGDMWARDERALRDQGAELAGYLRESARAAPGLAVGADALRAAAGQYRRDFDARWGGFGSAPKFPPAVGLMLLLRAHRRFGDAEALQMVTKTLDAMARGGMYDQLGGGFHRYSVDERWLVPHFEKMLYDNALLVRAYLEAFQVTGEPSFQRIAVETLDYVLREMTDPQGGFYSATDADSEGEEGRFFVWTPEQVSAAVGDEEDARRFCAHFDVTGDGNWEGVSVLNVPSSLADTAARLGVRPDELERSLSTARTRAYRARLERVPPALDDKVITSWNGLMIAAFAEGARVLGDPRYLAAATRAADFVLQDLRGGDGRLLRTWRRGRAHLDAYLEDYAYLGDALVDVYEAGGPLRHLQAAEGLATRLVEDFAGEDGAFHSTARGHEPLLVRHREGHDGATPAGNAVAASLLARLSFHLDRDDLRRLAADALRAYGRAVERQPRAFARSLMVVDFLLDGPVELAFVGRAGAPDLEALRRAAARHFLPSRIVAHGDGGGEPGVPLLAGKTTVDGGAALYVCRDFACQRPVTDPDDVAAALEGGAAVASRRAGLPGPERLPGHATPEGTARHAAAHPAGPDAYRSLGSTGLRCSALGFGGYRVDEAAAEHRDALDAALAGGIDLVDTSTNYGDGGSERLIGAELRRLAGSGQLARDAVIVVSKAGYLQGEALERAQERDTTGSPWPEVVKYADGVWHCIHPEFLRDQLDRSLERLGLETLDVFLLHNPEYFLMDAHERSHGTLDKRREELDRRLREAFAHLEAEARAGRISWYGVSSNTLASPPADPVATSLTRMLAQAQAAGGASHRFRVVQLPFNLLEAGAFEQRDEDGLTLLERAARAGVGVLVNRPLNASAGERLVRLAEVEVQGRAVDLDAQLALLAELESEYRGSIATHLEAAPGGVPPEHFFHWSAELRGASAHVQGVEHWNAIEAQRIVPRLMQALQVLDQGLTGPLAEEWQSWRRRYLPELQRALEEMRRGAQERARRSADAVRAALDGMPDTRRDETLARRALWLAASAPGVSCVLNGMRAPSYVRDAFAVLEWPSVPDLRPALAAVRADGGGKRQ